MSTDTQKKIEEAKQRMTDKSSDKSNIEIGIRELFDLVKKEEFFNTIVSIFDKKNKRISEMLNRIRRLEQEKRNLEDANAHISGMK